VRCEERLAATGQREGGDEQRAHARILRQLPTSTTRYTPRVTETAPFMRDANSYDTEALLAEWRWLVPAHHTPLFVSAARWREMRPSTTR
jgi:hypothetical protein